MHENVKHFLLWFLCLIILKKKTESKSKPGKEKETWDCSNRTFTARSIWAQFDLSAFLLLHLKVGFFLCVILCMSTSHSSEWEKGICFGYETRTSHSWFKSFPLGQKWKTQKKKINFAFLSVSATFIWAFLGRRIKPWDFEMTNLALILVGQLFLHVCAEIPSRHILYAIDVNHKINKVSKLFLGLISSKLNLCSQII